MVAFVPPFDMASTPVKREVPMYVEATTCPFPSTERMAEANLVSQTVEVAVNCEVLALVAASESG